MNDLRVYIPIVVLVVILMIPAPTIKVPPVEETQKLLIGGDAAPPEDVARDALVRSIISLVNYTRGNIKPIVIVSANGTPVPQDPAKPLPPGGSPGGHDYPEDDLTVIRPPSFTAEEVDAILQGVGSPAAGTGQDWYDASIATGVDDGWMLAFFGEESTWNTNPANANPPDRHNPGNIKCSGRFPCDGEWSVYPSWRDGIMDMHQLARDYNLPTIDQVIARWAPRSDGDNCPECYADFVKTTRFQWQNARAAGTQVAQVDQSSSGDLGQFIEIVPDMHSKVNAGFWDTSSGAWAGQPGGYHLGVDYLMNPGEIAKMPLTITCVEIGHYDTANMYGDYIRGTFSMDGGDYELYMGHMNLDQAICNGSVPAGTPLGDSVTYNGTFYGHTHVQLKDLDGNCEGGYEQFCDFEEFTRRHGW